MGVVARGVGSEPTKDLTPLQGTSGISRSIPPLELYPDKRNCSLEIELMICEERRIFGRPRACLVTGLGLTSCIPRHNNPTSPLATTSESYLPLRSRTRIFRLSLQRA